MKIAVYCGASSGKDKKYAAATEALGSWLVAEGHTLVYGGGKAGLMGLIADRVLALNGQVIGFIPQFLKERELAHSELTELHVVETMTERKLAMAEQAEAFIALPGGPGTLEEISEMVSWARIGQNPYPCLFYNVAGYYDGLAQFFDKMVTEGFLSEEDRTRIFFSDSFSEMAEFIRNYQPPEIRTY